MSSSLAMRSLRDFVRDESGATAIEYAMIAAGIAGAIIAVVTGLGTVMQGKYQSISDSMNLIAAGVRAAASRRPGSPGCRARRRAAARPSRA